MAEFVLGLTKTAVQGTVSRVLSAIEEEAKLKAWVQNDLLFITGEFQMMQSFLNVANSERTRNAVVRTWVSQLRELAFDVEDCVDFVVHLDNKSAWWWRVVPSCMAPPLPLDKAVAEIKQLKARVEDVSTRNTRYNLISDTGSHSMSEPVSQAEQPPPSTAASAFHILSDVWEAAGKRCGMDDLAKLINSQGSTSLILLHYRGVISLWGSIGADLGASYIIKAAYDDPEICQGFKRRAWVKLVHPFIPDEFLKSLLTQLYPSSHQQANVDMKAKLMQQMRKQKYLVVLEHVSTVVEWDAIKMCLPDSKNGSRIVLSTNELRMALLCTGKPYQVSHLRWFSGGQSLCAFFSESSGHRQGMGELVWQLRCPGVISVWGTGRDKLDVIQEMHNGIMDKSKEFYDGVKCQLRIWVSVPEQFSLLNFATDMLMKFYSEDGDKKIEAVQAMEEADILYGCCKLLREEDYLLVIEDLQSMDDWDLIKDKFLSEPIKGCIVVITDEQRLATYCVDRQYRALNVKDLMKEDKKGRVFSNRMEEESEWTNKVELVGRGNEVVHLDSCCGTPGVICVWGFAGAGKSALVRNMYYRRMLPACYPYETNMYYNGKYKAFSWVDVPYPFNLTDLSRHLLMGFHSDDLQAKETAAIAMMKGQDPIEGCCKFLREDHCLVVMDGLRSTHDWDLIQDVFLSELTRGNIVVITNEESVATYCASGTYEVINLKGLEADVALKLFTKIAWGDKQLTPQEMELSESTTAKCGGLPKVIEAIGSSEYTRGRPMETSNAHPGFHSLRGVFSWMQSNFDACSDSLKPCIFYLSVFPSDRNIRQRRLLRRWVAEGYARDTPGSTAEENGDLLFSELVNLSIIQPPPSKVLCKVNGFFLGYIISQPMEANLVFTLEGRCSLNSQRAGRHLTIWSTWDRDINVYESIDFSRLRSLTVFGKWEPFLVSEKMKRLRVLDLEDTSGLTDEDLKQILRKLQRSLKFLSLRGCKKIVSLPDSLGGMKQLQTLDIRHTSIVTLPPAVIGLQKIQYICAGTTKPWDEGDGIAVVQPEAVVEDRRPKTPEDGSLPAASSRPCNSVLPWLSKLHRCQLVTAHNDGVEVPAVRGFGYLTCLQTLGVVNVGGAGGKTFLKELKKLTQLRKLGVSGVNRKNNEDLCCALSGHPHLETLSVQVDKDKQGFLDCLDGVSQPPETLKSLKLYGDVRKLPAWVKQLGNLQNLDLELTVSTQDDIHALAELPRREVLRHLCVKPIRDGSIHFGMAEGYCFFPSNFSFPVLKIDCSSKLHVSFDHWIVRSVQVLKIQCSGGASLQFSSLPHLRCLKEVWLMGSYDDALKENLQHEISNLMSRPVLKLVRPPSSCDGHY